MKGRERQREGERERERERERDREGETERRHELESCSATVSVCSPLRKWSCVVCCYVIGFRRGARSLKLQ